MTALLRGRRLTPSTARGNLQGFSTVEKASIFLASGRDYGGDRRKKETSPQDRACRISPGVRKKEDGEGTAFFASRGRRLLSSFFNSQDVCSSSLVSSSSVHSFRRRGSRSSWLSSACDMPHTALSLGPSLRLGPSSPCSSPSAGARVKASSSSSFSSSSAFLAVPERFFSSKTKDDFPEDSSRPAVLTVQSPQVSSGAEEKEADRAVDTLRRWLTTSVFPSSASSSSPASTSPPLSSSSPRHSPSSSPPPHSSSSSSHQVEDVYTAWLEDLRLSSKKARGSSSALFLLSNYIQSRNAAESLLQRYGVGRDWADAEVEGGRRAEEKKKSRLHAAARAVGLEMPLPETRGEKDSRAGD